MGAAQHLTGVSGDNGLSGDHGVWSLVANIGRERILGLWLAGISDRRIATLQKVPHLICVPGIHGGLRLIRRCSALRTGTQRHDRNTINLMVLWRGRPER